MPSRSGLNRIQRGWSDADRASLDAIIFVTGLRADQDAVTNRLSLPWSSGTVEGHVNRIEMLKRQSLRSERGVPPVARVEPDTTTHRVNVDGTGIQYQVTGQGRPVILLHGFPDSGRLWRHQVPALATAGFQVIVPDLRGYGRSDKPADVQAYSIPRLAADVGAVLADLAIDKAHVVGHDWGAALGWAIALGAPASVDHFVAMSVGHPATMRRTFSQREKSWYMLLFQFPEVAERWLSNDGWANLRDWAGHPDADEVIADLEATGSLTPGLNWYRANVPPESWLSPPMKPPPVQAPTMGIWSSGDRFLTEVQMTDSAENVTGPWRYEHLDGPGHWMQLEAPDQVNALLLDFLPR